MLQRAMSLRPGEGTAPTLINQMLAGNFKAMERLGEPVMKPFLQASAHSKCRDEAHADSGSLIQNRELFSHV